MRALISDFDGTITRTDFYVLIAQRYVPKGTPDYFAEYRAGRLTHFEAMAAYFSHAPTDAESLEALMRDTEPDPRFAEMARRVAAASWDLIIVSAGSSWYIDRILSQAGVSATVHANPGHIEPGRGLVLEKPRSSPFFSEQVGIDKSAVVRHALERYEKVAFAGDGPPDITPSLLVTPHLRFARGYLAAELRRRGEAFVEYRRWSDIPGRLGC